MHRQTISEVRTQSSDPRAMIRLFLLLSIALVMTSLAGCGSQPGIRVEATPADLALLAGHWNGEFTSDESGRNGSITFTLTAGKDTAYGDVIMIPRGSVEPLLPAETRTGAIELRSHEQVLSIRFVRVEGGEITGDLTPYRDPGGGNIITTTFRGRLSGDTIEGTYAATALQSGERRTGHWKVTRTH